ncbi:MAG: hypothetical protein IJ165_13915 [Proteobacteria bacterium]|nr:hypothetical protein [Pseudomonadota bacterium]
MAIQKRLGMILCMFSGIWALSGCGGEKPHSDNDPCADGACQEAHCNAETCPDGACLDGECVRTCAGASCDAKCSAETCPDGECVNDECLEKCLNGRDETGRCMEDAPKCKAPDADRDGISDADEGRSENRDTDGDGEPDYLDDDSDGDTIPDSVEARNGGCSDNRPADTDYDGEPDYLDDDSDGNGIPDRIEAGADPAHPIDTDGDGEPDVVDDDNDGDGISDVIEIYGEVATGLQVPAGKISADCDGDGEPDDEGTAEAPRDCDANGMPDYLDPDSDGDTLPDAYERFERTGQWFARYSSDSDGNGEPDREECGGSPDENGYLSACVDTDGDGKPDYLDLDDDGDSLPDIYERAHGLNPKHQDTDGDGADDLIEIGAGTDPTDPNVNPQSEGNFVFKVPYRGKSSPEKQTLSFETAIQLIDLFFIVDNTGSMGEETQAFAESLPAILQTLQCTDKGKKCEDNNDCAEFEHSICSESGKCIQSPAYGDGCFDKMQTGIGFYSKMDSFWVASAVGDDVKKTVSALKARFSSITTKDESYDGFCSTGNYEPPYQMPICALLGTDTFNGKQYCRAEGNATCKVSPTADKTCGVYSTCKIGCSGDSTRLGCAGFRNEAIRLIIEVFDEEECALNKGDDVKARCDSFRASIGSVLKKYTTRYIGLWGTYNNVAMEDTAKAISLAVNGTDQYAFEAQDANVVAQTIDGVRKIAKNMPIDVTTSVEDIDENASKLVKALRVNVTDEEVQGRACTKVPNISGEDFQSIGALHPGTSVCYDVIPLDYQDVIRPTSEPQVVRAKIKVMGDGSTLNSGIAYFLIPPVIGDEQVN